MMDINFDEVVAEMKLHGMDVPKGKTIIQIPNGTEILKNAMTYFLGLEGKQMVWLPEYEEIGKWLENSEGRGLFLFGSCGRGKTILSRFAIPAILLKYIRRVCCCFGMEAANRDPETVLQKHILSLDDIGTEEISNRYGNKRVILAEVVDAAEKYGKVLILTSNLSKEEIIQKYGDRVFERIISTTKRIAFNGKSLRA